MSIFIQSVLLSNANLYKKKKNTQLYHYHLYKLKIIDTK